MAVFKFSPDPDERSRERQKMKDVREEHHPEFVYIDEQAEQYWEGDPFGHAAHFETLSQIAKARTTFPLRLLTFAVSLILVAAALVVLSLGLGAWVLSLLFLRSSEDVNDLAQSYFSLTQKLLVFSLGTFVATFSLALGLGIVVLYLMIRGENIETSFINRFTEDQP